MISADTCPRCGTPRRNLSTMFCGQCGTVLAKIHVTECPKCGTPRKSISSLFCSECGTVYGKPVPSSSPPWEEKQEHIQDQTFSSNNNNSTNAAKKPSGHHDVFISYSSKDKPVADAVCASIEMYGVRCWIAPRDVLPGEDFPKAIINGINGSTVMVLIFSSSANASPHVTREVTKAVGKGIIIIPFRIEDTPMSESMEYLIGLPHWLDALSSPLEQHIDTLVRRIKSLVDG